MSSEAQLSVCTEASDGTVVLRLAGRLDGTNTSVLEEAIAEQIEAGETVLLFDFEELTYISSAGLRVLLMAARKMQAQGGKALFCSLSEQIAEVFEVSGFNDILSVYGSREEALAAL